MFVWTNQTYSKDISHVSMLHSTSQPTGHALHNRAEVIRHLYFLFVPQRTFLEEPDKPDHQKIMKLQRAKQGWLLDQPPTTMTSHSRPSVSIDRRTH